MLWRLPLNTGPHNVPVQHQRHVVVSQPVPLRGSGGEGAFTGVLVGEVHQYHTTTSLPLQLFYSTTSKDFNTYYTTLPPYYSTSNLVRELLLTTKSDSTPRLPYSTLLLRH